MKTESEGQEKHVEDIRQERLNWLAVVDGLQTENQRLREQVEAMTILLRTIRYYPSTVTPEQIDEIISPSPQKHEIFCSSQSGFNCNCKLKISPSPQKGTE